jgi:hypothetical protein
MARSSSSGDELRASVEARRELGPDYEDSLVEGFLEKMDQEIDRRVDEKVVARARQEGPAVRPSVEAGQRLALAIISLALGVPGTVGLAFAEIQPLGFVLVLMWAGIIGVNLSFNHSRQHRSG